MNILLRQILCLNGSVLDFYLLFYGVLYTEPKDLNFLLLPLTLEQVLWFGAIACLDSWLYTFTILPLRFLKALSILGQWIAQNVSKRTGLWNRPGGGQVLGRILRKDIDSASWTVSGEGWLS